MPIEGFGTVTAKEGRRVIYRDTVIEGTYQIIQEIGRGGTGVVYLAYHLRLQKYVVLKNSRLKTVDMEMLRNEVDTLKGLHHPSLPQVYDFLQIDDEIYTVIDYIDGEDFERIVSCGVRFEEEYLAKYLLELAEVLCYLHRHEPPVLHSDIKPGNIMLREDGNICLIDFNISIHLNAQTGIRGYTQHYSSPEQFRLGEEIACGMYPDIVLDGRSDIYSLGATFYYIMTGIRPNEDGNGIIPLHELSGDYTADFVRIVEKTMYIEPELRFQTAEELVDALKCYLRRGTSFRKKCVTQAMILCITGLMICFGIWSIVYGVHEKRHDRFLAAYSQVQCLSESGDYEHVIKKGIEVLNEYDDQEKRNPENWFFLLRAVADSYIVEARDDSGTVDEEQLRQAAYFYYEATITTMKFNLQEQKESINTCANLLMELKDSDKLKKLISAAELYDLEEREILSAQLAVAGGDCDKASEMLQQFLSQTSDTDLRYAAYMTLAAISNDDTLKKAQYLECANSEKETDDVQRMLAKTYMQEAKQQEDVDTQTLYQKAAKYYAALCSKKPIFSDWLGYASATCASGDLKTSEEIIEKLLETYPNRYEVATQAALIKRQMGQLEDAKQYAQQAKELASDAERQKNAELWSALAQILAEP